MKKPPAWLGTLIYCGGKPLQLVILMGSRRAYVVIRYKDEVLVVKNWIGMHNKWHLPGGGVKGKESPVQGAARELKEELGLEVSPHDLTPLNPEPLWSRAKFWYWIYEVSLTSKPQLRPHTLEIIDAQWIPEQQLRTAPQTEPLPNALRF